jgi:23S rRNA pseudouridine2605 synthase
MERKKPRRDQEESNSNNKFGSVGKGRSQKTGRSDARRKPEGRKGNASADEEQGEKPGMGKTPFRTKSPGRLRRESGAYPNSFDKPLTRRGPVKDDNKEGYRNRASGFSADEQDKPYNRDRTGRTGKPAGKYRKDSGSFAEGESGKTSRKPRSDWKEQEPRSGDSNRFRPRKPESERKERYPAEKSFKKRTSDREEGYGRSKVAGKSTAKETGLIRLNRYIANSGICSRREADQYILAGAVKVNGKVVTELGTKVSPSDRVQYDGQSIRSERLVYVLLNKPKGFITTTDDPFDRKTVMALVENAVKERIYPVGRLDRNTTGLLLLTNDGDLAKKLTHPKHKVRKVYHVELDKPLIKSDMLKIIEGIELEDGIAVVDEVAYTENTTSKKDIGIELHSGKNRIVRRIFEALGYDVLKLDRVIFAGLTKKDLPRGKWRILTDHEISYLKMLK